jgi:hypothetical protein
MSAHPKATMSKPQTSLFDSPLKLALLAVFLAQILSFQKVIDVWTTGMFHDTDDATRLVQVRDWMAGQGWFDLTLRRMDPPEGIFLHWSRVLDAPIAAMIGAFGLVVDRETAERLTRLLFPALEHLGFFFAMMALGRRLLGDKSAAVTVLLALFTTATTFQFLPGRLDHHGAQIILLVMMASATLDAVRSGAALAGMRAGLLAALSLAISVENLPFLLTMAAILGLGWISLGNRMREAFAAFGWSLPVATSIALLLTVGPQRYGYMEIDSLSTTLLLVTIAGGAACLALALASPVLHSVRTRILATLAACVVIGAIALMAIPGLLTEPKRVLDAYGLVDPFVREAWLSQVSEAQPIWKLVISDPGNFLPIALPMIAGFMGILLAAHQDAPRRASWMVITGFGIAGIVASCWQVRAATSAAPLLIFGGAWAVMRVAALTRDAAGKAKPLWPMAAALPFMTIFWAQVTALKALMPVRPAQAAVSGAPAASAEACYATANLRTLNKLPPSLLMNQIDHAGYILAETPHSVIASAYHRNNRGNLKGLKTFLFSPDEAHAFARHSGAKYLVICRPSNELNSYAQRAPQSLAALLSRGEAPDWLKPVDIGAGTFQVYEIR